jgi:hypothetical protein
MPGGHARAASAVFEGEPRSHSAGSMLRRRPLGNWHAFGPSPAWGRSGGPRPHVRSEGGVTRAHRGILVAVEGPAGVRQNHHSQPPKSLPRRPWICGARRCSTLRRNTLRDRQTQHRGLPRSLFSLVWSRPTATTISTPTYAASVMPDGLGSATDTTPRPMCCNVWTVCRSISSKRSTRWLTGLI